MTGSSTAGGATTPPATTPPATNHQSAAPLHHMHIPTAARTIPAAGVHGGDVEIVATALGVDPSTILDLSASMNPAATDPLPIVYRHLRAGLDRYPNPARAHAALAEAMGIDEDQLLLTNGGAEAISLVAAEIGGRVVEPAFALHPRGGGPLWRANPGSPSGLLAAASERADVWDEAFYSLATGEWTRGDDGIAVGSLTKLLAAPGLRIGYILADPEFIVTCRMRQPGWSVNGLVCAALPDLLQSVDLSASAHAVAELRSELVALLASYHLATRPSDVNWVLVDAPGLRETLAPQGVLVRDCSSFDLPGVARIAVPDAGGLARLDTALARSAALGSLAPRDGTTPTDTRSLGTTPHRTAPTRTKPQGATPALVTPQGTTSAGSMTTEDKDAR
ncbi:MAG: aminotransferase class I/II-fold pyridoxal phosphate-dependent enzyme [Nakamurella sp.]